MLVGLNMVFAKVTSSLRVSVLTKGLFQYLREEPDLP